MAILSQIITFVDIRLGLLTVFSFLFVLFLIKSFQQPKNLPPGPWSLPIVGYLLNIAVHSRWYGLPLPAVLSRLSKKYGPVFSLYLGDQFFVVLGNQQVVREAFMHPNLNDRPTTAHTQNNEETGILNASGPNWRAQRAFTLGVFRRFGVGKSSFEHRICSELEHLLRELEEKKTYFDPTPLICTAISNVTSLVTVARRYDHGHPEFQDLLANTERIVKLAGSAGFKNIVKILRYIPSTANKKLAVAKQAFMKICDNNIRRRKSEFSPGTVECMVDVYLTKLHDGDELSPHINTETVKKTVGSLFMAGTDTSSYQILWIFVYLLRYSKTMKKVQEEIDSVVGRDRLPRMADKQYMPFTQAVILEVMRIAAPVHMGVMHSASRDTTLQGFLIPEGTMLISNIWGVHHDPDTWKEPSKFDPGRFLDEDGGVVENEALIPFSVGRRVCLGENLARMEIFLFVTHVLHHFNLGIPDGKDPPSLEGVFAFNYSTKPFEITATKRE